MFLYIFVALIGLAFGSFVNAFVWRLHEQEQIKERHPRPDRGSSLVLRRFATHHLNWVPAFAGTTNRVGWIL